MKPEVVYFSFKKRAAEKAAARAIDDAKLKSGEVSRAEMSRINGGHVRGCRYKGPSERMRALAESDALRDQD